MKRQKINLEYFRTHMPKSELEQHPHHKAVLYANDCKLVKKFKGNPAHWHFYSRELNQCFTVEMGRETLKCISNN